MMSFSDEETEIFVNNDIGNNSDEIYASQDKYEMHYLTLVRSQESLIQFGEESNVRIPIQVEALNFFAETEIQNVFVAPLANQGFFRVITNLQFDVEDSPKTMNLVIETSSNERLIFEGIKVFSNYNFLPSNKIDIGLISQSLDSQSSLNLEFTLRNDQNDPFPYSSYHGSKFKIIRNRFDELKKDEFDLI